MPDLFNLLISVNTICLFRICWQHHVSNKFEERQKKKLAKKPKKGSKTPVFPG